MFRERAKAQAPNEKLDRPFRLVTVPARLGLGAALIGALAGLLWLFGGQIAVKAGAIGLMVNPPGNSTVIAPISGVVETPLAPVGMQVTMGEQVTSIRASDGTVQPVLAPISGTVVSLSSGTHAPVAEGAVLLTIAPNTQPMAAILFVPAVAMGGLAVGIPAEVSPTTLDTNRTGFAMGYVTDISPLPVPMERLVLIVGTDGLAEEVLAQGPVHEVVVDFLADPGAPMGIKWSGSGPDSSQLITSGTIATANFVLRQQTPWQAFIGSSSGTAIESVTANQLPAPTVAQLLPVTGSVVIENTRIELEVARTPEEKNTGLMFRQSLEPNRGMAFVFDAAPPPRLPTKDLLFPIDILFIADGVVVGVDSDVQPCDAVPCPTYPVPPGTDVIIELNAGIAQELQISPGKPVNLSVNP